MRTPAYLYRRDESLATRLLLAPLVLLEGGYRLGARLHRAAYRSGLLRRQRLPIPVVSVGNLCAGGSAKTPLVRFLAEGLHARGVSVAVLSRGVGGRSRERVNVVSDGERALQSAAEVGDEAAWLASKLVGVPVLAGRNRYALGLRATALFAAELALLDDGFQHHRLARDLDLVCVDARLGLGNGHTLPRGPLRESTRVLRGASALVFTRASLDGDPPPRPRGLLANTPVLRVALAPAQLLDLGSGEGVALESLRGERVGLFAGVARPEGVVVTLEELGARVVQRRDFPDHHRYRREDLSSLEPGIRWVTTAKDATKLPVEWLAGRSVLAIEERVEEPPGQQLVDWVLQRIPSLSAYAVPEASGAPAPPSRVPGGAA